MHIETSQSHVAVTISSYIFNVQVKWLPVNKCVKVRMRIWIEEPRIRTGGIIQGAMLYTTPGNNIYEISVMTDSGNGLSSVRCHTITWNNDDLLDHKNIALV